MNFFKQEVQVSRHQIVISLLLLNGFLIALTLAFAKAVTSQGVSPISYAFWQALIAACILILMSCRDSIHLNRTIIQYFIISGLSGIAIPNVVAFFLVGKLGAGYTSIMFALPPMFTFLLSASLGLEKLKLLRLIGLLIAVLACTWIIFQRHSQIGEGGILWYALGIVIPLMLSIGNVYRSVAWPKGIKSMPLAAGTLLASALSLCVFGNLTDVELVDTDISLNTHGLILVQGLLTALNFFCAFELQKRSNPVFYSQLGTVAAIFGLLIGVVWFNEAYSLSIWLGVFFVIFGLRVSNKGTLNQLALKPESKTVA
jgi:drug/metabolite transporter (DMT)-like permease